MSRTQVFNFNHCPNCTSTKVYSTQLDVATKQLCNAAMQSESKYCLVAFAFQTAIWLSAPATHCFSPNKP